ncbi:MAG: hypothetical protein ACK4UJ_12260 [Leptonema sp. (in: bacteria)]
MNVENDGFLNHYILQTIGISEIRNDGLDLPEIQMKCLSRAEISAKKKLISILIHTNQSIRSKSLIYSTELDFNFQYPINFSTEELVYYSMFFESILSDSNIVYQEITKNQCKVILRIEQKDLIKRIQQVNIKKKFLINIQD